MIYYCISKLNITTTCIIIMQQSKRKTELVPNTVSVSCQTFFSLPYIQNSYINIYILAE